MAPSTQLLCSAAILLNLGAATAGEVRLAAPPMHSAAEAVRPAIAAVRRTPSASEVDRNPRNTAARPATAAIIPAAELAHPAAPTTPVAALAAAYAVDEIDKIDEIDEIDEPATIQTMEPSAPFPGAAPAPLARGAVTSAAYIEQLSTARESFRSPAQPVKVGEALLSDQIAAMQVEPSGALAFGNDREIFLAEAPQVLMVRLGGQAIGQVALQVTDTRAIAVQVGQLLDLIAGRYEQSEFAQLRQSDAASSFVTLDQLRAAGIDVQYDAVYDELRLDA